MNSLPLQPIRSTPASGFRLVFPDRGPNLVEAGARQAVEEANRAAATLATPERGVDARRILALTTAQALEGGRAAILRPDRRRLLVSAAGRLGLRPFEANLVIAIVQDGARRGVSPADTATAGMIDMVPAAVPKDASQRAERAEVLRVCAIAVLLAAVTLVMLINWVGG